MAEQSSVENLVQDDSNRMVGESDYSAPLVEEEINQS